MTSSSTAPHPLAFLAAFAAGSLLTVMVMLNGMLATSGSLLFSSWVPHGTGAVAAIALLLLLRPKRNTTFPKAPLWAYLGGVSGGFTVMLTSYAVNTPLALSGTIGIGLAGQIIFSLVADARGMFGLPQRMPGLRDLGAIALIAAGTTILIIFGQPQ